MKLQKPPEYSGGFLFAAVWLVGRRGFEPLISALRGRCPGPLDERPTHETPDPRPTSESSQDMLSNTEVVVNLING